MNLRKRNPTQAANLKPSQSDAKRPRTRSSTASESRATEGRITRSSVPKLQRVKVTRGNTAKQNKLTRARRPIPKRDTSKLSILRSAREKRPITRSLAIQVLEPIKRNRSPKKSLLEDFVDESLDPYTLSFFTVTRGPPRIRHITDMHEYAIRSVISKLSLDEMTRFCTAYPQYIPAHTVEVFIKKSISMCYGNIHAIGSRIECLGAMEFYQIPKFDCITLPKGGSRLWMGNDYVPCPKITKLSIFIQSSLPIDLHLMLSYWPLLTDLKLVVINESIDLTAHLTILSDLTQLKHLSLHLSSAQWQRLEVAPLEETFSRLVTFNCNIGKQHLDPTAIGTQFDLMRLLKPDIVKSIGIFELASQQKELMADLKKSHPAIWSKITQVQLFWSYWSDLVIKNNANFFSSIPLPLDLEYLSISFEQICDMFNFVCLLDNLPQLKSLTHLTFVNRNVVNDEFDPKVRQFIFPPGVFEYKSLRVHSIKVLRLTNFFIKPRNAFLLLSLFPKLDHFIIDWPNRSGDKRRTITKLYYDYQFGGSLERDVRQHPDTDYVYVHHAHDLEKNPYIVRMQRIVNKCKVCFRFPLKSTSDVRFCGLGYEVAEINAGIKKFNAKPYGSWAAQLMSFM